MNRLQFRALTITLVTLSFLQRAESSAEPRPTPAENSKQVCLADLKAAGALKNTNLKADLEVIDSVDFIESAPESQESELKEQLMPLMNKIASALEKSKGEDFRAHFLLSRIYMKLGMEDLAKIEAEKAEKSGLESFKFFALLALQKQVLDSNFQSAAIYFPYAERFFPDDPCTAVYRAIQLHREGKIAEEEKVLEKVLEKNKRNYPVLAALAALRAEEGKYKEALSLLDLALAEKSDYEPAQLGKIKVLYNMKHYVDAAALAIDLYQKDYTRFELADLIANSFCHLQMYWEAYQPALVSLAVAQKEKQMGQAKDRIRFLWKELSAQQRSKGLHAVSRRLNQTVFGARFHFALADALQKAGYFRDAENQFKEGLSLDRDHASAYKHLADIYLNNYHMKKTAIAFYHAYLSRVESDTQIEKRLERLLSEFGRKNDIALRLKNQGRKLDSASKKTDK